MGESSVMMVGWDHLVLINRWINVVVITQLEIIKEHHQPKTRPKKTPQVTPTPNIIYGCTDEQAINYNKLATVDNNSCRYEEENGNLLGTIALLGGGGAAAYYFIKKKKKTTQS